MNGNKQRVLALLERLPNDSSLQDIIYHIAQMAQDDAEARRAEFAGDNDDEGAIFESFDQAEWDRAWAAEAARRMADIESGIDKTIPADVVLAEARARLSK